MNHMVTIIENEEVKTFIRNNSDDAIEFVKKNFDIEKLYSCVVENLNEFIDNDRELVFENIKEFSKKYTIEFLKMNSKKKLFSI